MPIIAIIGHRGHLSHATVVRHHLIALAMARITVEDCIDKIPNRYELVLIAANRARSIAHGAATTVDTNGDTPAVVALREIAQGAIPPGDRRRALIQSLQYNAQVDEPDASGAPLLTRHGKDTAVETLTEEQLLGAMRSLVPSDASASESDHGSGSNAEKEE